MSKKFCTYNPTGHSSSWKENYPILGFSRRYLFITAMIRLLFYTGTDSVLAVSAVNSFAVRTNHQKPKYGIQYLNSCSYFTLVHLALVKHSKSVKRFQTVNIGSNFVYG